MDQYVTRGTLRKQIKISNQDLSWSCVRAGYVGPMSTYPESQVFLRV
jgi:hypothetical protein